MEFGNSNTAIGSLDFEADLLLAGIKLSHTKKNIEAVEALLQN